MSQRVSTGDATSLPPLEKGRSASVASRVGIKSMRFDRTSLKTTVARRLRRDSTDVEMKLWQGLRNRQLGVDFRRQHPVGSFILDFYCSTLRLAVELDGGQHAIEPQRDQRRDAWLAQRDVTMLRFWNCDVTGNFSGVIETIAAAVSELQSTAMTPTRRWRADLPLSGGGDSRKGRA